MGELRDDQAIAERMDVNRSAGKPAPERVSATLSMMDRVGVVENLLTPGEAAQLDIFFKQIMDANRGAEKVLRQVGERLKGQKAETTLSPEQLQAKVLVENYLYGKGTGQFQNNEPRVTLNEDKQQLEFAYFTTTPNERYKDQPVEKVEQRMGVLEFNSESAAKQLYQDLPTMLAALQPMLEETITQFVGQGWFKEKPPADAQQQVERTCHDRVVKYLSAINNMYAEQSLIKTGYNDVYTVKDVIVVRSLPPQERTRRVAEALNLDPDGYVNEESLPSAYFDADGVLSNKVVAREVATLLPKKSGAESTSEQSLTINRSEMLPPIPAVAVRALERFVDDEGKIKELFSAQELADALIYEENTFSAEAKSFAKINKAVSEIGKVREQVDLNEKFKVLEGKKTEQDRLEGEIATFLNELNPPQTSLDKVTPKGLFGGNASKDQMTRKQVLEKKKADLEREVQQLQTETAGKSEKQVSMDESELKGKIKEQIMRFASLQTVRISNLVEKSTYGQDLPTIKVELDKSALEQVAVEPLATLEQRLRQVILDEATKVAERIRLETEFAIKFLTKNFPETKKILEITAGRDPLTRSRVIQEILSFVQGRIMTKSTDAMSMYDKASRVFYCAGQDSANTANPNRMSAPIVPSDIAPEVALFGRIK